MNLDFLFLNIQNVKMRINKKRTGFRRTQPVSFMKEINITFCLICRQRRGISPAP